jgi:signal transduction histidine kinase
MVNHADTAEKRVIELELALEEERSLSQARNKLLEANIKELNEVYDALKEKLNELRRRNEKIRIFEEKLVKANKLSTLGELASSIAHEIKNPLISIQGFARRIGTTGDRDKLEKYAKFIEQEADRLTQVLTRLLGFSRMDEPKKDLLDMNVIVDDTVMFMEHHLTRFKNVELVIQKEPDLPMIQVDKIHVQQAMVNIIMNAAQAMPEGGKILIRTGKKDMNVFISITDTGVGIKEEDLDRIFEPFFTTKEKEQGTGLGLSLCKRLIEANAGTIEVESKAGEGTTFTIMIPISVP